MLRVRLPLNGQVIGLLFFPIFQDWNFWLYGKVFWHFFYRGIEFFLTIKLDRKNVYLWTESSGAQRIKGNINNYV